MARKEKKKGSAKGRRAALKGFASRAKGMFQSPVHSNGYKQDMLIDLHGGDRGLDSAAGSANDAAVIANTAGKSYFKYGGTVYKVVSGHRGPEAGADDRAGRTK